ncbi:hypothetical protein CQ14_36915 [Bradyrhizobium lablabi]|uniref:DUF1521 domain-containing protein n=1 Tax=Bradyrhizobium lablabi TaxID=722472 RepID=A0A0R3MLK1_9BRAD|nr:DUF1521 domain-containing protein [Bradyrhizobium lablabi]ANU04577.1 type III effector NopE [Bradyrhizobium lablabi]KRR17670.1 hypothetical protein CQ14_36915 [Bradyrhizobium lablabi]
MPYLPVVGGSNPAVGLVPEGVPAVPMFNVALGQYAGAAGVPVGAYQYLPVNSPVVVAPAVLSPAYVAPTLLAPPPPPQFASVAQNQSPSSAIDPVWTHEVHDGKATIHLGDKYTITADEKDGTWTVRNNETGHVTKIHGDPHVDANGDGKDDFDFKKGMTLQLDDGTKITIDTADYGNGKSISSKLTITNGSNAMVVEGLGDDKDGANNLKVTQSNAGLTLDALTSDGSQTIHEQGQGWVDGAGREVDQASIDAGEEGRAPGAGSQSQYTPQPLATPSYYYYTPVFVPPPPPVSMTPVAVNQSPPPKTNPVWSHEVHDGKATIHLGDKYTITADEKDGTWTVRNNETGHVSKIHGDPHVDANGDGKDDFDFKKGMTLQLDDGTKITVDTVDYGKGKTISSKLTITNGDNAMVVEGLGDDKDGANNLKVTQSNAGQTLDQLTSDGAQTIYEQGQGWVDRSGWQVNQASIDANEQAAG